MQSMPTDNLILYDVSERGARADLAGRLDADLGALPAIHHEFDWKEADVAQYRNLRFFVLLAESEQKIRWYLPIATYSYTLRIAVGPVVLWPARVTRFHCRDLRTLESLEPGRTEERIVQAFVAMRRELPDDGVLFFESVPESLAVRRAFFRLAASPEGYRALRWGPAYMHRTADISGGLDAYLKRLGSKTRADLRRTRRRFEQKVGNNLELFVARSEADIERLVGAILTLAPKTWQYKEEKAGPRGREVLLQKCRVAARSNMLRSYVLYVNDEPIAFQIGYVAHGVFDAYEIGYDPAWRKSQPGILLHVAIVMDLGISCPDITRFDFGVTDRLHKSRLSTDAVEEGFYYLFPNSIRGRLLYSSLRVTMAVTEGLKTMRDRLLRRKVG